MRKLILFTLLLLSLSVVCSCSPVPASPQLATIRIQDNLGIVAEHTIECDVVFVSATRNKDETAYVPLLYVLTELGLDVRRTDHQTARIIVGESVYDVSISDATITLVGDDSNLNQIVYMVGTRTGYIQPDDTDIWVDVDTLRSTAGNLTDRILIRYINASQSEVTFVWGDYFSAS